VYGTFLVVKVEAPKTAGIDSPIVTVRLVNDQGLAESRKMRFTLDCFAL
jgi:hypothetical protein